ncbi:MAG: serine protease [Lachnospiraceae bacterium]|nr:serine protease [Lachnospiraceae bacterium]
MSHPGTEENRGVSEKGFVRERIVNRQFGKRWLRRVLAVGVCGILFGLTAGITIAAILPKAQEWFTEDETTQSPIVIPPDVPSGSEAAASTEADTESNTEETMEESTESTEESEEEKISLTEEELREFILDIIKEKKKEWLSDPGFLEEMCGLLAELGETYRKALVTIELKGTVPDWFDDPVVTDGGQCAGMIWNEAEDGTLYLIASGMVPTEGAAIQVVFADNSRKDAVLCQVDSVTGLMMLKVNGSEIDEKLREEIQVLPLGNSYMVDQGDLLLVMGNTNGYVGTVVPTVVTYTGLRVNEVDGVYRSFDLNLMTTEGANGFVISPEGKLVGIITPNTAGNHTGMLAISDLKGVLQLLANSMPVPYLGISGQTVTEEISAERGLPQGVYVTEVVAGSPAYEAGIKPGDILTGIGESKVMNIISMRNHIEGLDVSTPVTVVVMRAGSTEYQELTFQVLPGTR